MIKLTWNTPTTHSSGRPLSAGELTSFEVEMQVSGAPSFTRIATPVASAVEFDVDVSDPGTYNFRVRAISNRGTPGVYAVGSVTIDDTSPISAPGAFTVALV